MTFAKSNPSNATHFLSLTVFPVLLDRAYFPGGKYLEIDQKFNGELDFGLADFTISFWVKTAYGGTILSRTGNGYDYNKMMKIIFIEHGVLKVKIGLELIIGKKKVNDDKWHHIALAVKAANKPYT